MSDASEDEFVSMLEYSLGPLGYAMWFKTLEIIAKQMDETDRCWAEYPLHKWRSFLGVKQKKLSLFLELIQFKPKNKVVLYENKLKIEIPKLLELRDNYTKNLQATSKQLTTKEVEVEVEVEKKNKDKKVSKSNGLWIEKPDDVSESVWNDFKILRRKKNSPFTETANKIFRREVSRAGISMEEAMEICCMRGWQGFNADWYNKGNENIKGVPGKTIPKV